MNNPSIVLVHGAWADGSSWSRVVGELDQRGFDVLAPPNPLRGIGTDAAYLDSFIAQRTAGPVVVVAHSYGGVVATNATADRIAALVYVNAFIPAVGESVLDVLGGSGSALDQADPTGVLDIIGYPGAPEGDAEAFLKPAVVHDAFAQDLPLSERRLIATGQRPLALGATALPTTTAAWQHLPNWAVLGTDDRVIPIAVQRAMAERAGATISEVAASHVSMLSRPDATVAAIALAAAAVAA